MTLLNFISCLPKGQLTKHATMMRTILAAIFFSGISPFSTLLFGQLGSGPGLDLPLEIVVEADGSLVVVDAGLEALVRVDPVSGDRTILSGAGTGSGPRFGIPEGIAVEADGSLAVADFIPDALVRVDPVSGDRTILSGAGIGSGPGFVAVRGIAVEADSSLVVTDLALDAVVRVDPVSGDRTVISDVSIGSGPGFDSPVGIAVEADGSLVVTDVGLKAVVRVDPVSGDRTTLSDAVTSVEDNLGGVEIPQNYSLAQNYPNPFNPTTAIRYEVPVSGLVQIAVYNMLGQKVRFLVNETMTAGDHIVHWDGKNDGGQILSSGAYLVWMKAEDFVTARKMTFLK